MTRHNLQVQLAWLLGSPHNVPKPPVVANSLVTLGAEPYSLSQFPSQVAGPSLPAEIIIPEVNGPNLAGQNFVRPVLPASANQSRCSDEMVRLQSAAKPSTKPRLLSQALPELAATPKQHPVSRPTSLEEQYNAAYSRGNAGM